MTFPLQYKMLAALFAWSGLMGAAVFAETSAQHASETDAAYYLERFGLPTFFSTVFIVGVWRVCSWLGPRIESWIREYLETQRVRAKAQEQNAETLKRMASQSLALAESNAKSLERLHAHAAEHKAQINFVYEEVKTIHGPPSHLSHSTNTSSHHGH